MRGKRVSAVRSSGKYLAVRRKTARRAVSSPNENRPFVRFLICGLIFVLLVGIKLLFPQLMAEIAGSAVRVIGGDADFREAFAAVGRAVSGDSSVTDSLQEAYTAVFHPSGDTESQKNDLSADIAHPKEKEAEPANRLLKPVTVPLVDTSPDERPADSDAEELTDEIVSCFGLYSELPDNASFEQRNLGFSYVTPVHGVLSSSFGWREHPVFGGTRFHYGVDLAADTGTEIYAFADGEVFATGVSSTLGKYIILSHAGGYKTLYAHCSEILVKSGSVKKGDRIAEVGDTGETTGAHLHFELQHGKLYLNPIYYVSIG